MQNRSAQLVRKIATFILCMFGSFTLYGVLGQGPTKGPASVAPMGAAGASSQMRPREVILKSAKSAGPPKQGAKETTVLMNDPFVGEKWGLLKTETRRAWEITQGSKDIIVAVIDTGIDLKHKDLVDNLWVNKGETGKDSQGRDKATNGVDDDGNGFVDDVHGWNFVSNNADLSDNHGHGTHIAGIVGAKGGNGFGISGVAPKVTIMPIKYYDPKVPGANNLKNTIQSIRYAIRMGAQIINYSGGGMEYSAEEFAAIKEAEKKGILFIAAAGNERSNSDDPSKHYYPADYELSNIISVTAVNRDEIKVLPSSNYGVRTVDLAAPGENIYSTLPGNNFGLMTGTSQATAFVTGVAVLIMSHHKELAAADVKKYILRTGDEYPTLLSKTGTAKLLNSYKALTNLDRGVSISGVVTANTSRAGQFSSSREARPNMVDTSALSGDPNLKDPAEEMSSFGRDFIRVIGMDRIGEPRRPARQILRPQDPDEVEQAVP
ncbi:MAG TPA: S8 family peptidase [Pseudobdellovibrionaceae bacterium]|nr:S8 family peptidase [Pseudobdellovibrionaceae bacterium]